MQLEKFIKKRPYLIWYTKNYKKLSAESIVETVLNHGDWADVQALIKILGIKETAKIFWRKSKSSKIGRQNYSPKIVNYFNLYFNKYARIQRNFNR